MGVTCLRWSSASASQSDDGADALVGVDELQEPQSGSQVNRR